MAKKDTQIAKIRQRLTDARGLIHDIIESETKLQDNANSVTQSTVARMNIESLSVAAYHLDLALEKIEDAAFVLPKNISKLEAYDLVRKEAEARASQQLMSTGIEMQRLVEQGQNAKKTLDELACTPNEGDSETKGNGLDRVKMTFRTNKWVS